MKILVINSGSSSIKYQLFKMPKEEVICSGLVERIGLKNAKIHYKSASNKIDKIENIANHKVGLEKIVTLLLDKKIGRNKPGLDPMIKLYSKTPTHLQLNMIYA